MISPSLEEVHSLLLKLTLAVSIGALSLAAQSGSGLALAGYGYQIPQTAMLAAPGQLLVVSVYGLQTKIPNSVFVGGPDHEVNGISVSLTQEGQSPVPVGLYGYQQNPCSGHVSGCQPMTSLTVQIPFELGQISASGLLPALEIRDNGAAAGQVPILPVTDRVHILNSCDAVMLSVILSYQAPAGTCAPIVQHGGYGPLVTVYSPTAPGETLSMFLYGMGATDGPFQSRPTLPFTLTYDYRANAPGTRTTSGGEPATMVEHIFDALYQVNFVVPAPPGPLVACGPGVTSNLTVSLNGPASMDSARLCVQPQ